MSTLLSKDEVLKAFALLGKLAQREGFSVELFVVGGVVVMLGHPYAEALREGMTHDVDVVFVRPNDSYQSRLRALIGDVGSQLSLPNGWLNDSAAKFVTRRSDGPLVFESQGIVVRRATDVRCWA
jgi:hypothetical protein